MSRASLDKDPREVAAMFDGVAAKYDITNDVMTGGMARRWRHDVYRAVAAQPGERILDIAAGTGTSSAGYAQAGAQVIPADFSMGMLLEGRRRHPSLPFTAADALHLPFADQSVDVVTMSYGLRNVSDVAAALADFHRVTKPGGRLVIAELSKPVQPLVRTVYVEYLMRALPAIARRVSSSPDSYVYLAESIRAWPSQEELAQAIADAGWQAVRWRNLLGGIATVHHAVRPA